MRKNLIFTVSLIGDLLLSQVGINTDSPHQSAALDIQSEETGSNKKGILIPRVQLTSTTDTSNNPARGLLVYNTRTQNDVLQDNFYYFDGTRWNPLISNNNNRAIAVPELAAVARLEINLPITGSSARKQAFTHINFDNMLINNSNLISYDEDNGLFTVNSDGVYAITLQVGLTSYPESELVLGIADETDHWIGRSTFYQQKPSGRSGSSRLSKTYSTYIEFNSGDQFRACIIPYSLSGSRSPVIQGIESGTTGSGNVTNISIVKY